jgi:type IV fimbrial biogenesis protein FimT
MCTQPLRGHTLIEILIVLTITGIVSALAIPGTLGLIQDSRRTSAINALVRSLQYARSTAAMQQRTVVVCRSADGETCSGQRWSDGWIVFADLDRDRPPERDPGEPVLARQEALGGDARMGGNRIRFSYRPFGRRSTNGTLVYCDDRGPSSARAVVVSYTGRPRIAREAPGGGALSCPD